MTTRHRHPPLVLFALVALVGGSACAKRATDKTESAPEPASASASASTAPAPSAAPSVVVAPPASASASPADRYAENLERARSDIKSWKCSPNKPVALGGGHAAIVTFRCPENTIITAFDAMVDEGFVLVGAGPYPERGTTPNVAIGAKQMELRKTRGDGLLHRMRDGKTSALIVRYVTLDLVPVPTGYRVGSEHDQTRVFELANDDWSTAVQIPDQPERGFLFGRDPVPIFPREGLGVHVSVCRRGDGDCSTGRTTDWTPLELYETWDGARYADDLRELAPAYQARLRVARPFVEALAAAARAAQADAGAGAAPPVDAGSATSFNAGGSDGGASASDASAAPVADPPYAGIPGPYASDDAGDCPLGVLRAVMETVALARILDDRPEPALSAADAVMDVFPAAGCKRPVPSLPTWAVLRKKLLDLPAPMLRRTRGAP